MCPVGRNIVPRMPGHDLCVHCSLLVGVGNRNSLHTCMHTYSSRTQAQTTTNTDTHAHTLDLHQGVSSWNCWTLLGRRVCCWVRPGSSSRLFRGMVKACGRLHSALSPTAVPAHTLTLQSAFDYCTAQRTAVVPC